MAGDPPLLLVDVFALAAFEFEELLEELLLALSSEKSISGSVSLLACSEGMGLSCVLADSELDSEPSCESSLELSAVDGWGNARRSRLELLVEDVSVPLRLLDDLVLEGVPGTPPEETDGLLPLGVDAPPLEPLLPELLLVGLLAPELPDEELLELLDDCSLQATSARRVIINMSVRMIFL